MTKPLTLTSFRRLEKPSDLDWRRLRQLYDWPVDPIVQAQEGWDPGLMQAWDVVDTSNKVVYELLHHSFDHAAFFVPATLDIVARIILDELVCQDEALAESLIGALRDAKGSVEGAYLDNVVFPDAG